MSVGKNEWFDWREINRRRNITFLSELGVNCEMYHAGMSNEARSRVHHQFLRDEIQVCPVHYKITFLTVTCISVYVCMWWGSIVVFPVKQVYSRYCMVVYWVSACLKPWNVLCKSYIHVVYTASFYWLLHATYDSVKIWSLFSVYYWA